MLASNEIADWLEKARYVHALSALSRTA